MIVAYEDLAKIRENHLGKRIVFCSGTFDLTHAGHILFFEDCKKFGDVLVVGVGDDQTIKMYKGQSRPILNESIRLKTVDSLKHVDYCFLDSPSAYEEKVLCSPLSFIFSALKPDAYVINDETFEIDYRKMLCEKGDVKLVVLKRECPPDFESISTTKILEKIKSLKDC